MIGWLVRPEVVLAVAKMLCAETLGMEVVAGKSAAAQERAGIVQVVLNRARDGRFGGRTVLGVVRAPRQFAGGCPLKRSALRQFEDVAFAVLTGRMQAPAWARTALSFTTRRAADFVQRHWSAMGFRRIQGTETLHVFWEQALSIPEPEAKSSGMASAVSD